MNKAEKWSRIKYQPCLPLGDNNSRVTGCEKHIELSYRAACEGIVLLKNNNYFLPIKKEEKVASFGIGQIDYIKGGSGSGDVNCEYVRNIYDGLKLRGINVFDELSLYYKNYVEKSFREGQKSGMLCEPELPDCLISKSAEFTDVAIITISRFSGEGFDRKNDGTDDYFYLSISEKNMIDRVCKNFENVIVLLNTGAMIDTSWFSDNDKIKSALFLGQGGMEGGLAAVDALFGNINPSGRLVDTSAKDFDDYPSSEGFHESKDYVKYTDDIFVGYRYFETIPGKKERVVYPFGFGLSYTEFEINDIKSFSDSKKVFISLEVKNIGCYAGKEVVQVYFEAPTGKITKAKKELCAFKKTKILEPNESETLILTFNITDMASYDDIGNVEKSAYVMEKGEYRIYVGKNVREAKEIEYKYILNEDMVCEKLTEYCKPKRLEKRLTATGEYVKVPDCDYAPKTFPCGYKCDKKTSQSDEDKKLLIDVANDKVSIDEFLAQLTDEQLLNLTVGQKSTGVANTDGMGNLPEYGVPAPMTCDGPAGVRIEAVTGIRTTAFPVATTLACTWNEEILKEVGKAGALEAKENNLSIWLTPALNIHRSPLCGRNFEYYSEDPFLSGKMAAAMVRGIQSQNIAAAPKHFVCNNKETNRAESDSIVSERALREIYLKGFEICVKESNPKFIMTSYNVLNSVRTSENAELITGILRGEWGFKGAVMSDWWNHAHKDAEVRAGNDVRMPTNANYGKEYTVENTRDELAICAKRLLEVILWLE